MKLGTNLIILPALVLLCFASHAVAAVKFSIASQRVSPKQEIAVPVSVTGAEGLGAIEFDVTYDPAVCTATAVEKGKLASNTMVESNVAKPGRVRVALISQNGVTGDGAVATIHFVAKDAAGKSPLALEHVRAWAVAKGHENMTGMKHLIDVQTTSEAGSLTVAGSSMIWFIVGGGLVMLMIMIAARSRKKRTA